MRLEQLRQHFHRRGVVVVRQRLAAGRHADHSILD
jgi:hypothetical protein